MADTFSYSLIRAMPDPRRGEWVNIGVCVYLQGRLDIRVLRNLSKLRVLAPSVDATILDRLDETWNRWAQGIASAEERQRTLATFPLAQASPLGAFISSPATYDAAVESLMRDLVAPPPVPRETDQPTRLETTLRNQFRRACILGTEAGDIDRHRVVPRYPIDASANLYADFALRNGKLRITETIDFRVERSRLRTDKHSRAALKCVTLAKAAERYPDDCVPSVVYIANEDTIDAIQPSLTLLGNYAERIYDAGNHADLETYFTMMQQAAGALA